MDLYSAVFYTNDIDAIENFYHKILGLEIEYRTENKFISFLFPNGVRLGIKKAKEEREVPGNQTIFIKVDDIQKWYDRAKELKLEILKELTEESWATNFSVLDPDKNKVQFVSIK